MHELLSADYAKGNIQKECTPALQHTSSSKARKKSALVFIICEATYIYLIKSYIF